MLLFTALAEVVAVEAPDEAELLDDEDVVVDDDEATAEETDEADPDAELDPAALDPQPASDTTNATAKMAEAIPARRVRNRMSFMLSPFSRS